MEDLTTVLLQVMLVGKDQIAIGFNSDYPFLESEEAKEILKNLADTIYKGITPQIMSSDVDSLLEKVIQTPTKKRSKKLH